MFDPEVNEVHATVRAGHVSLYVASVDPTKAVASSA